MIGSTVEITGEGFLRYGDRGIVTACDGERWTIELADGTILAVLSCWFRVVDPVELLGELA